MKAPPQLPTPEETAAQLGALSIAFGSLGRALICADPQFRVVHVSRSIERFVGEGAVEAMLGQPVSRVLGEGFFGTAGPLRRALEGGERREGWGATLDVAGYQPRRVSMSASRVHHEPDVPCDPRVAYFIVLRPGEEDQATGSSSPTLFSGLLARSASMLRIFQLIENLEESDATVLITGESGTGKELVARAIHQHSPRRNGVFVAVNCGALPDQLLESELFGHVKGAFTGAVRDRKGRFELASRGTLFLDEVGEMPLHLQVKLLRVLQERTFERVGESHSRSADARIIAATNKDLRRACLEGDFREDLFFRLRVVPVEIPPLRSRREDIEPLVHYLLSRVAARYDRALRLAPAALREMIRYDWPGNVRELENALEYAVAICRGQTVHAEDLPAELGAEAAAPAPTPVAPAPQSSDEEAEAQSLRAALDANGWRRGPTAAALGMSRTTLWRRMRELRLAP
jgi:transcriptional regulator with PAS, ATPase and Fis domain